MFIKEEKGKENFFKFVFTKDRTCLVESQCQAADTFQKGKEMSKLKI